MDQLPPFGRAISQIILPTFKAYAPLLRQNSETIKSTRRETFPYGPHPRQHLDVYTPSRSSFSSRSPSPSLSSPSSPPNADKKTPLPVTHNPNSVFIFLYGGGFVNGAKILPDYPEPGSGQGLVYANLGHFFAENLGVKTVVIDYRLISHGAKFPSGGRDLELAIEWVVDNLNSNLNSGHGGDDDEHAPPPPPPPLDLYIMGNSAGGVHLATYLLAPDFAESRRRLLSSSIRAADDSSAETRSKAHQARLKGVIFLSVPFHFDRALPERKSTLATYYGDDHDDDVRSKAPLGLLRASRKSDDGSIKPLQQDVSVLVLKGSLDPEDEILGPIADFADEWLRQKKKGTDDDDRSLSRSLSPSNLEVEMMPGQHNHISPVLSLGTGIPDEEAWGRRVVEFVATTSRS
ncbi:hypothetical protein LTS15_007505 [Exophiala xenobiotica]|nr:hypothetical protein LTS15_007505 [Exophiala xenobiotica]